MTGELFWTFGAVLCVEGLFLALAPGRLESLLNVLANLPIDARRLIGATALTAGIALLWLGRYYGA